MNAASYVQILETTLLPAVNVLFHGDKYRFMQDNDPKHTSKRAQEFFAEYDWWKTPPESPDLNPIENLLKEYIRQLPNVN